MPALLPDPAIHQARLREALAQDSFVPPALPDWKLERRAVTAYKVEMVRQLRAIAAVRGYTHAQLAWRLRLSPRRARRLLDGLVFLDEPDKLHRLVLRLDPQVAVPAPDTIPAITPEDRAEADAKLRADLADALAEPGPGVPVAEVFARLRAKLRADHPLSHLLPEGRLTQGRYTAVYARDPDTSRFHGEVENLRDPVRFQAPTLAELEQAFAVSIADYEAFCHQRAA